MKLGNLLRRLVRRPAAEPDRLAAYAWMRHGAPAPAVPPSAVPLSAFTATEPITEVAA